MELRKPGGDAAEVTIMPHQQRHTALLPLPPRLQVKADSATKAPTSLVMQKVLTPPPM